MASSFATDSICPVSTLGLDGEPDTGLEMTERIFEAVLASAERMGGCDPKWLKQRIVPDFITVDEPAGGPQLLLLHGLFGALSNWDTTIPYMRKFCRPTALQFPILTGHRSEVRVKALAAFTEFYIRTQCKPPVALCGNSLGGHVAMRLCLANPELVDCLILSGPSGLYEHSVDTLPVRPNESFIRDHMKRVFFHEKFITDEGVQEILDILSDRKNTLNLIHAARSAKKDNLLAQLKNIKVPTLLVWGDDDEITTLETAKVFHENIPNSELVTLKQCGHAPMIESPDWFAKQVQGFLEKRGGSGK